MSKVGPWILLEPRELFAASIISAVGTSPQVATDWRHAFDLLVESRGKSSLFIGNGVEADEAIALADSIYRHPLTMESHIVIAADHSKRNKLADNTNPLLQECLEVPNKAAILRAAIMKDAMLGEHPANSSTPVRQRPNLGLKLLVAEDNPVNQKLAQRVLEQVGCTVTLAENGLVALHHHIASEYDAILMDIQMPVLDGLEATRQIRRQSVRSQIPIVALTANALVSDKELCLEAGMNGFITKPFKPEQVVEALQSLGLVTDAAETTV